MGLTYPGGATGNAVNVMAIGSVSPFSATTADVLPGTTGSLTITGSQNTAAPQAPATLTRAALSILGSSSVTHTVTLASSSLSDRNTGANIPSDGPKTITLRRGDANNDGKVDIFDAVIIGQYTVGLRQLSELNAINAASVSHDGNGGDKIDIFDAVFIGQQTVGLRNDQFQ